MRHLPTAIALVLAFTVASPVAAQEADRSPLMRAAAYLQPDSRLDVFSFVDWVQLKQLYGVEDITSASPLAERQQFLLEVARNESLPVPLGLGRLTTWSDTWGWDTTDLDWQAQYLDGRSVLRFGGLWDPAPFRAALASSGYEREPRGAIEIWWPPDERLPTRLRLERTGHEIAGPPTSHTYAPVTISPDGRTVVIHGFGPHDAPQVRRAARPNLSRIEGTPVVLAAVALGDVVTASIAATSSMLCAWSGPDDPFSDDPTAGLVVEELHRYQARATGYTRASELEPALVRYVFVYEHPEQADADLAGRTALVQRDHPWGPPADELELLEARADGGILILDVQPLYGHPGPYTGPRTAWAPFAMCGA